MLAGMSCIQDADILCFRGACRYKAFCCPEAQEIYWKGVADLKIAHGVLLFAGCHHT